MSTKLHTDSITAARAWLLARRPKGAVCPCCDQFSKQYARPFTKSMAYVLLLVARYYRTHSAKEWLHIPSFIAEMAAGTPRRAAAVRGDWAKMVHWGLLEQKSGVRTDLSPRLGYYRLTDRGRKFALRKLMVPSHVLIYNKQKLPYPAPRMITIDDALKKAFSYAEIMQ